jgi:hypothetical protein
MPIQFRCNYCNQLLSIATRKSGAVVNCPTCDARIIVPRQGEPPKMQEAVKAGEAAKVKGSSPKPGQPSFLERGDFDDLLKAPEPVHDLPEPVRAPVPEKKPAELPPPSSDSFTNKEVNVECVGTLPVAGTALVLTPARATIIAVGAIVLLALAFLAGLFVGRTG